MKFEQPSWANMRITGRHWHYLLVAVLVAVNLFLAVRLAIAWNRARAGDAVQLQQRETSYKAMLLKTMPLRGLDKKIDRASADQQAFYLSRFPDNYSTIATELGVLKTKNNVLLNRLQYAQGKLDQGLYEVRMDASVSGDYGSIMRFINSLERDKLFFLIDGIALNGQENGVVSLHMRLTTYIRAGAGEPAVPPAARRASNANTQQASIAGRK